MLNLDKISYQDKIENKEITYDGQTFNVRSWIPMEDKLALIGNIINALILLLNGYFSFNSNNFYIIGIRKAFVFPLPVFDSTYKSLFAKTTGVAYFYTGNNV